MILLFQSKQKIYYKKVIRTFYCTIPEYIGTRTQLVKSYWTYAFCITSLLNVHKSSILKVGRWPNSVTHIRDVFKILLSYEIVLTTVLKIHNYSFMKLLKLISLYVNPLLVFTNFLIQMTCLIFYRWSFLF